MRFRGLAPLLLLAASIGAALVLSETVFRVYEATLACHRELPVPRGLYQRDPRYRHALSAGYRGKLDGGCWETEVEVSASGTRGAEIPEKGTARRILLAGDSYVFGLGVGEKETLPVLLGEALAARGGRSEVINAGVPGWTTYQAALLIEDRAENWRPDLFLVHVYLGNDVEERVKIEEPAAPEPQEPAPERGWRLPSSHLLRALKARGVESAYVSGARRRPLAGPWFDIFLREAPARVREGYHLIAVDLERIRDTCSARGIGLRVVVTPSWMKVLTPTPELACRAYECEAEGVEMDAPRREMAGILDRLEIPFLDLTETMVEGFERRRYRFVAGHWDAAGTRIAAERIASWMAPPPS